MRVETLECYDINKFKIKLNVAIKELEGEGNKIIDIKYQHKELVNNSFYSAIIMYEEKEIVNYMKTEEGMIGITKDGDLRPINSLNLNDRS